MFLSIETFLELNIISYVMNFGISLPSKFYTNN